VKLILYVEGETERYLPQFFEGWLNARLQQPIGIKPVNLGGASNYIKEIANRVKLAVQGKDVIAVIGLIDLYGSGLGYPDGAVDEKYVWARQKLEAEVAHPRFRQHFAVYETEAWLLSDRQIFPRDIIGNLPRTQQPETINFRGPPSQRLRDLYRTRLQKKYNKPLEGSSLFRKLDPELAYSRCPHLKLLLDDMLALAREGVRAE
jgi:uncharacterized protein DUF4276